MIRKGEEKLIWSQRRLSTFGNWKEIDPSNPAWPRYPSKTVKIVLRRSLNRIGSLIRDVFLERQRMSFVVMPGSRFVGSVRNPAITSCFGEVHAKHSCNGWPLGKTSCEVISLCFLKQQWLWRRLEDIDGLAREWSNPGWRSIPSGHWITNG